ncbi:sensor histidine kinase YesM [Hypnocyclicus thermotrophus]|uniref:Sensor histidine kinase YesM n=1 Tax=Hypnocyclicus thermotrophus TaxID=1627895 RepID=A0AA46DYH4_9FUSO|nr:histidine kinase [Hypnocyclicus thermotrophus]TDT70456.1 sensor histidine kinase YesM [Hypnocyclicus thermotrophus]
MKKIKSEIFKKLSFAYIAIIFIPVIIIAIYIFYTLNETQEIKIKKDRFYRTEQIANNLNENFFKLERIKTILRGDFELLEFLTSEKEKKPLEYLEIKKTINNYEKILSISKEISEFKIYVDNKNLLEIQPIIKNHLPDKSLLKDNTTIIRENNKNYIYSIKKIYFYPKSVYLELKIDLDKIIGKDNGEYYFVKNDYTIDLKNGIFNFEKFYKHEFMNKKKISLIEDNRSIIYYKYIPFLDMYFINYIEKNNINKDMITYGIYLMFIAIISLIIIYYISYFVSIRIFEQLEYIIEGIKEIKNGNLDVEIPLNNKVDDFYVLTMQINSMTKRIKKLIEDNIMRERKSREFEIKALQSQINSHFLQNTLESIKMIAYINKDYKVSKAITNLGRILRYSMNINKTEVKIYEEIDYIKRYIELFSIRTDEYIEFRYFIGEELKEQEIPKMILQPLVENSILHGIIPSNKKGIIQIKISRENKNLIFDILDNGIGIRETTKGSGIGLENIKERLNLYFKSEVIFKIKSEKDKFTRILIKIKEM